MLTNFLNLTGERSDKVMLVFATNHAQALDEAMKRRIDDAVEMPLPGHQERIDILKLYRDKLMIDGKHNTQQFIDSSLIHLADDILPMIADETNGLSGGELEGVINSIISDASITEDGKITSDMVASVVGHARDKHTSFIQGFAAAAA